MCLIIFAYHCHPQYPLIVAANRDEFYERPSQAAHFWPEAPELLAGKDLQGGGTWLGISKTGRFAAVTNIREKETGNTALKSRGQLTKRFLLEQSRPLDYLNHVHKESQDYAGFNLLLGSGDALYFYSNRGQQIQALQPGLYGISNGKFDQNWPKVREGKLALGKALGHFKGAEQLLPLLQDRTIANDQQLPDTGVGLIAERWLSPIFVDHGNYGTRSSTILTIDQQQQATLLEQNHEVKQPGTSHQQFNFSLTITDH